MYQNLDVFQMAHAMAVHAGKRQALVAQNVANADTPGYLARDIPDFRSSYSTDPAVGQRSTRTRHMHGNASGNSADPYRTREFSSPDGNTVSVEQQMLKATETIRQHNRAIAIYKSAMDVLRMNLSNK